MTTCHIYFSNICNQFSFCSQFHLRPVPTDKKAPTSSKWGYFHAYKWLYFNGFLSPLQVEVFHPTKITGILGPSCRGGRWAGHVLNSQMADLFRFALAFPNFTQLWGSVEILQWKSSQVGEHNLPTKQQTPFHTMDKGEAREIFAAVRRAVIMKDGRENVGGQIFLICKGQTPQKRHRTGKTPRLHRSAVSQYPAAPGTCRFDSGHHSSLALAKGHPRLQPCQNQ